MQSTCKNSQDMGFCAEDYSIIPVTKEAGRRSASSNRCCSFLEEKQEAQVAFEALVK